MLGYWNDPERTAATIDAAGWLHTGDLGTLDEDGYCNIVGRAKDMVIRGGENIFPREIEEFLYTHPAIDDAHVFGVPDPVMGEEVVVWVRPRGGAMVDEEAIRAFCRGRIAHYKIPRHVRVVEAFPTTASGKVQKFVMRGAMIRELELAVQRTA
jgi:fatty-acyl-CoA synthase